jgi:hypothetical protein
MLAASEILALNCVINAYCHVAFATAKKAGLAGYRRMAMVPRAGFEPATTRSSASPSVTRSNWVERSPRLSYLGTFWTASDTFRVSLFIYVFSEILSYLSGIRIQSRLSRVCAFLAF